MNEHQKLNINHAVTQYIGTKADAALTQVYRDLLSEYQPKLSYWASSTYMANDHDMTAIFDDTLIKTLDVVETNGGDFVKLFHHSLHNRYKSLLRKLKTRRTFEQYEIDRDGEEEAATSDIADDFNLAEEVTERITRKKKNDQRMLIEFLVSGENARTTAIVKAYLSTELKSPTAIGKHLGLDHKQVSRALSRLQAKYSTKQFGDYTDYLIAL
jgi:DNA-directed RNA polymerase specialized sigma24 family protein